MKHIDEWIKKNNYDKALNFKGRVTVFLVCVSCLVSIILDFIQQYNSETVIMPYPVLQVFLFWLCFFLVVITYDLLFGRLLGIYTKKIDDNLRLYYLEEYEDYVKELESELSLKKRLNKAKEK